MVQGVALRQIRLEDVGVEQEDVGVEEDLRGQLPRSRQQVLHAYISFLRWEDVAAKDDAVLLLAASTSCLRYCGRPADANQLTTHAGKFASMLFRSAAHAPE